MSEDYIVRAMAADNQIRAFAITSRNIVETADSIIIRVPLQQQLLEDFLQEER